MTLRKLKIYYTVAERLNMTEAARELYISQPSISQAVKELEEELGVQLLERIGRKLHLTEEGRVFRGYAVRMLNLYDESLRVMEDMREMRQGRIKVGASTTIGTYLLPEIVADFKKKFPCIDVELFIDNTQIIERELLMNSLDLAFIEGPVGEGELLMEKFWEDELVFISQGGSSWGEYIDEDELRKKPFIVRERGSGSREVYERYMGAVEGKNIFTFGSTEAIKRGVRSGIGAACVSKLAVREEAERGEVQMSRLYNISIERDLSLIYHRDKTFGKLIETFLEFARAHEGY